MTWTSAISLDRLRRDGKAVAKLGGKQIALFAVGRDVFACNNRCPHEGYPLREGTLDDGCVLTCNWIGLGAASVAVLILPQADLFGAAALTAIVVAFGIPMSYSSYHIYLTKSWPAGFDSFQVACGEALVAVCLMLPVFLATGGIDIVNADWTAGHWAILATVIITSLDCYLYFEIVRLAGPVFVSQANFVTVIAGVLWGMALHGEKPGHWLWVSVAFLVGSLLVLALGRRSAGVARRVSQTADS